MNRLEHIYQEPEPRLSPSTIPMARAPGLPRLDLSGLAVRREAGRRHFDRKYLVGGESIRDGRGSERRVAQKPSSDDKLAMMLRQH